MNKELYDDFLSVTIQDFKNLFDKRLASTKEDRGFFLRTEIEAVKNLLNPNGTEIEDIDHPGFLQFGFSSLDKNIFHGVRYNYHRYFYEGEKDFDYEKLPDYLNEKEQEGIIYDSLYQKQKDDFFDYVWAKGYVELLKHIKAIARGKNKTLKTYEWEAAKFNEVTKLFNKIKGTLIDETEELKNFKNIFSSKNIKEITPIKWHDGNASELLYFISKLMEAEKIVQEKRMNYERLKKCFVKIDGSPFTENLKVLNQKLHESIADSKKKQIDKLIKYLS